MGITLKSVILVVAVYLCSYSCEGAKINTPRVLLPWFENLNLNFTFEIIEGGCYSWSLSRDDIIDLEPLYENTCSRAARVSVSKRCVPPGTVIILAEEVHTGEILRGDVDVDKISSLKVMSTTMKLYLEEAPEAFEVTAYDSQGNKFSTLEGVSFTWSIENLGNTVGEDNIVTLVRWRDTDYEAPRGTTELEAVGQRAYSVLLYGQALGECRVTVCLGHICTDFNLHVVASVVLTPATAFIAPGDTVRYKVVRARAGRLTIQDVAETLYYLTVPDTGYAYLEDKISLVRGSEVGTTLVSLMSGATEVTTATLNVAEPHSIRVTLRPADLVIRGVNFVIHCVALDAAGHPLMAGQDTLIRLSVEGAADVDLIRSTENGTLTDAVARSSGPLRVVARLHSIAGKVLHKTVEGEATGIAVEPLQVVPPELFIAWTDTIREVSLKHIGGGDEPVTWSVSETSSVSALSLTPAGALSVRGEGELEVRVQLKNYPHVKAFGKVWSLAPELVRVSSSGHARVGKPHHLHIALTATHPTTGELFNFHRCNCGSFAASLLEGPEPHNVTSALWVEPAEGACCVLECVFVSRGVATLRVSRGRAGDAARVAVRAAPALLWPPSAAALPGATLPVLAEGEALVPQSSEPRVTELSSRDGPAPHRYPDAQLYTMKCRRKGESRLELVSHLDDERESVDFEAACAAHVSRIRLEPSETPGNCSGGPRVWLKPGQEVAVKVTLLDAIGRELLDEQGPRASWEVEPHHPAIEYRSGDRLLVETHPEFAPVPVPYKYYQLVQTDEQAIGWSGSLKVSIPEATASIQARVVGPLRCDPLKYDQRESSQDVIAVNVAWEGETVTDVVAISGGSGRYAVDAPKGVSAGVAAGALSVSVPGPGAYDLLVSDLCVQGEKQLVEVHIEEILSVEVSTSRAVCVGGCMPIKALVKGISHRYLSTNRAPEWRVNGDVTIRDGMICGVKEGAGRVRASLGGVWSPEVEVLVFPPLRIVPEKTRVPPGARLRLRHAGGPPAHLASLRYRAAVPNTYIEVSNSGSVHGLSTGVGRVKLVATDIANVEIASAEAEVEVIAITGLRVRAATQSVIVGAPAPLWVEGTALPAAALAALQPAPRLTWSLRDPASATLSDTHSLDMLERSVAEGLSVRVTPLKPGVITVDVRVRNLGQSAEFRSWDSTIEILGISDIRTSVDGLPKDLVSGDRLAIAVGSTIRLNSLPRSNWNAYQDGAFEMKSSGQLTALAPGHGVIVAQHKDERNNIYRETVIHVEVAVPHYCTAEPAGEADETAVRLALRNALGRELLAPDANVSVLPPNMAHVRRAAHSALGNELLLTNLEPAGAFMSFLATAGGVTVKDEVWVAGNDEQATRIVATGGWAVCLDGVGWRAGTGSGVSLHAGSGVTLALLGRERPARHALRLDRPPRAATLHQIPFDKVSNYCLLSNGRLGSMPGRRGLASGDRLVHVAARGQRGDASAAGARAARAPRSTPRPAAARRYPAPDTLRQATEGWAVCLDGVGWRAGTGSGVSLHAGSGVTLALLGRERPARHALRLDRPPRAATLHQIPFDKMEFISGEWPSAMVPLSIEAASLEAGPVLCSEEQRYAVDGVEVELPFTCKTTAPNTAKAVLDIINGQLGCSIFPPSPVTEATEVELCAEWGVARTCTKTHLLPPIAVSQAKVSLLRPPAMFTVTGHPRALKLVKITTSPGLKLEVTHKDAEIVVIVKNEASTCGVGLVIVKSKLTSQEIQVEVERECDVACGTLLGALFSILSPYLPTLMGIAAVAAAYMYIQSRLQRKAPIRMPTEPVQTVLPPSDGSPAFNRSRTYSRSPFASNGPSSPVYGDASMLPDSSFSPNSTRVHSRFL